MNQMEIFKNPEFGSVRVIEENGKYLFCGLDVTAALGYKDSAKALKAHCTSDGWAFYPLIDNVGRTQQTRFISEGNLYRLIVHSKLLRDSYARDLSRAWIRLHEGDNWASGALSDACGKQGGDGSVLVARDLALARRNGGAASSCT